jgi:hypothetical protein
MGGYVARMGHEKCIHKILVGKRFHSEDLDEGGTII